VEEGRKDGKERREKEGESLGGGEKRKEPRQREIECTSPTTHAPADEGNEERKYRRKKREKIKTG